MDTQHNEPNRIDRARSAFERSGGLLRMSDAVRAGVHRDTLRRMVEQGELDRVSRGLYQLVDGPAASHPDLAVIAARVPKGVICLISALAFHELTTQIPHEVQLAIDRNSQPPRIDDLPVHTYRFSGKAFTAGIETHDLGPITARIYSPEKTLADCFKYRNKIGLDTCLEALKAYRQRRGFQVDELMKSASICRVANVMRPYLEAIL